MSSGLSLSEGSVFTVLMPRQMPEKKCAWKLLCCLTHSNEPKNWTQASFCVERSLVLNVDQLFLSSPSCSNKRKQGYVRTPSCCFPNFKEMFVWNWNWFRLVFKRKYKVPSGLQCVLYFLQVLPPAIMGVPNLCLSAVVDSLYLVLIPTNLYLRTFSPTFMASVVILRDCVSWCVLGGHVLDVFRYC